VALLQESKLRSEDSDPVIKGYNLVRKDRARELLTGRGRGGGVVTLIKKGIPFQMVPVREVQPAECLAIEVIYGARRLKLCNVYVPPRGNQESLQNSQSWVESLPHGVNWLVMGDLNGHHEWWDNLVAEDARGTVVAEWLDDNRMMVLNDGGCTRVHKGTGARSTPDVTLCHQSVQEGLEWEVKHELSTDHFPIVVSTRWNVRMERIQPVYSWRWDTADWEAYQDSITTKLESRRLTELMNVRELECQLREVILEAARKHVGIVKLCTANRAILDREVRLEMEKRDQMKNNWSEENVEQVKEQEEKVRELLTSKKREKWMKEVKEHADYSRMWKLLNRLKERKSSGTGDSVLRHKGKGYSGNLAKANAFAREYASVSTLKIPKADRGLKVQVCKRLRRPAPGGEDGLPFTLREIEEALTQVKEGKAAGPDFIHPRLLRKLPPAGIAVVARLFDMSWRGAEVPQNWRRARVVPLLKDGKPPEEIPSYRPISLTATLGKWMERVVANRLMFVLETQGKLCQEQAGFRATRSVEDQLLRLSQDICDGFQARERTVLALFDFAKAYDKVWRTGLLHKLLEMGLSGTMVNWVRAWLANRRATVMVEQQESRSVLMREGLPQGSVLSPLLFLVYINDVMSEFPLEARVSIFADDMAAWAQHREVEVAAGVMQQVCDRMCAWSDKWHMSLNVAKCEVTLFSLDAAEARLCPTLLMNDMPLRHEANPRFLGVTFDRMLKFGEHVRGIITRAKGRMRILRAVASTEWGFVRGLLRCTYTALIRSVLEYAGPCWMPFISKGCWEKLEVVQREAARIIVGAVASSPSEAILEEAGLEDLLQRGRLLSVVALDRSKRLPEENPRRQLADRIVHRRLKKEEWREGAQTCWKEMFGDSQEGGALNCYVNPWSNRCTIVIDIGPGVRAGDEETCRLEAMARVERLGAQAQWKWAIYTDGSVAEGGLDGGAAAVVTSGSPDHLEVVHRVAAPAGRFASSYQAEMVAICVALEWLSERKEEWERVGLISDSLSGIMSLGNSAGPSQGELVGRANLALQNIGDGRCVTLVWVPGHCNVPGNELADQAAAEGSSMNQEGIPWCFDVAKAKIWGNMPRREFSHDRSRDISGTT
jgi:ribonuclease HI